MKTAALKFEPVAGHKQRENLLKNKARCNYCGKDVADGGMIAVPDVGNGKKLIVAVCGRACKAMFSIDKRAQASLDAAIERIHGRSPIIH